MTTTDPFTDAARTEATSRARRVTPGDTAADWSERMLMMEQFRQGAEWARTHLAAQEPTDAEVKAATLELYVRSHHSTGRQTPFESLDHEEKVSWVEDGRAVLSAARATRRDEEKR